MAKRRRTDGVEVDMGPVLRRELIERMRDRCARFRDRIEYPDGSVIVSPWPAQLATLEAGEPLEMLVCQLPAWARPSDCWGRVRVESDGSITRL